MSEESTKTTCCNTPIKYVTVRGDGKAGSPINAIFLYCSHCLRQMDGNGYHLIKSKNKIA